MKLENHLYLIKPKKGDYFLAYPLTDKNGDVNGWWDQNCVSHVHYDTDDIIGSVDRIIERKHVRQQKAKKAIADEKFENLVEASHKDDLTEFDKLVEEFWHAK
jgi:hypothetical protein